MRGQRTSKKAVSPRASQTDLLTQRLAALGGLKPKPTSTPWSASRSDEMHCGNEWGVKTPHPTLWILWCPRPCLNCQRGTLLDSAWALWLMGVTGGQDFLDNRLEVKTVDSESLAPNTSPPPHPPPPPPHGSLWSLSPFPWYGFGLGWGNPMTTECGNGYFIFYFKERVTDGSICSHS